MVTKVKISKLKPNPANPRLIKDDKFRKLVKSLQDFPEMADVRPIVVNKDMVVLGGNMRLRAMTDAGWKEVPVEVVDWPEEKQREFIIKDNVGFGEWDWEIIANEWPEVEEWGLDVPDWSGGNDDGDPFSDTGVEPKNQYGVIVMCSGEDEQEHIFTRLTGEGLNCKIVVT